MSIIEKESGRSRERDLGVSKLSSLAGMMAEPTLRQIEIIRYLCTSGPMDRDKVARYLSMADSTGMKWTPREKEQMLNANASYAPKLEADGTVLDGFEQQRIVLIESHGDAVTQGIRLLKELPPEPATISFLKAVIDEMEELARHVRSG